MYGIDQEVQQKADAYRGNPQMLQQKYAQNQQLIDLLALQKLKSDKEEATRQLSLQAGAQGKPPTIADQRESEALDNAKKDVVEQQAGVMQNKMQQMQQAQQKLMQSAGAPQMPQGAPQSAPPSNGIAALPAPNVQGMANGGIVAFDEGGSTMKEGMDRLLKIDPEELYDRRKAEAVREGNYNAEERAAKERQMAEAQAFAERNALGRALSAGAGYTNSASALANMGLTAVNNQEAAMKARHAGEGQLIDTGLASRIAGLKAGESAYGHGISGLYHGVGSATSLENTREMANARRQSASENAASRLTAAENLLEQRRLEAKEKAEAKATTDERERIRQAETRMGDVRKQIQLQMEKAGVDPGSPESIRYYDQINNIGKSIYDRLQIPQFFAPDPVIAAPAPIEKKPGMFDSLFGSGKKKASATPAPNTVPFSALQP